MKKLAETQSADKKGEGGMVKNILYFIAENMDPYKNIALEYGFFENCPKNTLIVFLWKNDNTVVIGKNQNVFSEVRLNELYADGGVVARRLTGGGAVFHDKQNLNFTFIAHDGDYDQAKQFSVVVKSLSAWGINGEVNGRNDMTVGGKKFSGNAFLHQDGKSMHHGTLLIDTDVDKMKKYLSVSEQKLASKGVKSCESRVINLKTLCKDLTAEALAQQILVSVEKIYNAPLEQANLADFSETIEETEKKLSSKEWIFNRVADKNDIFKSSRFEWGCVEVAYRKDAQGRICRLSVFTDSLDPDLSKKAQTEILGKKPEAVASQNKVVRDIISLINE